MDLSLPGHRQGWCYGGFLVLKDPHLNEAKRFFRRAYKRHGLPTQVTIDGSQTNLEAARTCHSEARLQTRADAEPLKVRQSQYMNNRIEQDHRCIKRRIRPMLGFKTMATTVIILDGIELIHMIRKGQLIPANDTQNPSLADQFNSLAA